MPYQNDIAGKARNEQESIQHITNALGRLIDWEHGGGDPAKKLPTLRLVAQSFRRHLENLVALKEQGGYLEEVSETSPHLSPEVNTLHEEHEQFQALLERIISRLERVTPTNRARLAVVADELFALTHTLEQHDRKETDLLQEAFLRDEGGEG